MEVGSSSLPGTTPGGTLLSYVVTGGLAQLARAPALQAGGQRFESVILHMFILLFYDWTISQFDNCKIVNREIVK